MKGEKRLFTTSELKSGRCGGQGPAGRGETSSSVGRIVQATEPTYGQSGPSPQSRSQAQVRGLQVVTDGRCSRDPRTLQRVSWSCFSTRDSRLQRPYWPRRFRDPSDLPARTWGGSCGRLRCRCALWSWRTTARLLHPLSGPRCLPAGRNGTQGDAPARVT